MTSEMGEPEVVDSNGNVSIEENRLASGFGSKTCFSLDPALINEENLSAAEEAAEQVLNWVHPTLDSEEKRRDVIAYVQQLVKSRLDCEAVSYGSVPLKTYLPDGDIDLTILKGSIAEESLVTDVLSLLEDEEQNENADYQVKDTQFIDAEVKLVKCLVQNIVVDITCNQLGGLSTLCFLEQVDCFVGKNHLFKRSIILIKTWCYYESRILGAHHGLISTYALETLVLYIFHFYHSSLSSPLAVLYRFLDYYSKFDWENYCISLKGPVHKSSLPNIVVMMPTGGCNRPLLSEEFLLNCMEMFSVPCKGTEAIPKAFQIKHLNIIDPLKENNNLGRSVHRGNFYRIRCAFKYGAHKLGQVLSRSRDEVAGEILNFFSNTRARHEHQHTSISRHLGLEFTDEESPTATLSYAVELFSDEDTLLKSFASDFDNDSIDVEHTPILDCGDQLDRYSTPDYLLSHNNGASLPENHFHKLHEFTSKSSTEDGSSDNRHANSADSEKFDFNLWLKNIKEHMEPNTKSQSCMNYPESICSCLTCSISTPKCDVLESLIFDCTEIDSKSIESESDAFNPLANLTGDYDSNIRSLLSAQLCHGFASSAALGVLDPPSSLPLRIQNKEPCDILQRSISHKDNELPAPMNNILRADSDSALLRSALHSEAPQKTRGIGTYFPNMSACYMERAPHWGRNNQQDNYNHLHKYHNNGYNLMGESNSIEKGSHEVMPTRRRYQERRSDMRCEVPSMVRGGNQINEDLGSSCRIEFGSIGNLAEEVISSSAHGKCSTLGTSLGVQDSMVLMLHDRVAAQSIHLKNDDEFPPLCL